MEKEHLEIILEDMNGKFDLLLEDRALLRQEIANVDRKVDSLSEQNKFETKVLGDEVRSLKEGQQLFKLELRLLKDEQRSTNQRLGSLERKVDGIATDLTAHRADTEVHVGYQVRERPDGD